MKGPVGIMGITSGVAYYDNVTVYESLADITDVSLLGQLTSTWAHLKE